MEMDIKTFLEQDAQKDILRFSTAGSVDDGKSTLIGRLLHDSKTIYEDQLASIKSASGKINNDVEIDFALLTDGLKAEREQGITIDVAYRYFSTPKRKFIIADTPGHEQYTRNMATGASTADLAVILIDARYGVLTQSRRHAFISSLLRIPHMVVAINKMDLVDYSQEVFENIRKDFSEFATKLNINDIHFVPVSALKGDNVVDRSENMPWYHGSPILEYLENVYIGSDRNLIDLRMPVQYVLRPNLNFRGYSGKIASGIIKKGDEVLVVPSMKTSKIKSIVTFDGELDYAFAPLSVTVTLEDELDISRGDMLVHKHNLPENSRHFEAMLVWMDEQEMSPDRNYVIKHTTRTSPIRIDELRYKVDVNTMHRKDAEVLKLNEIGRVVFTARRELYFDPYEKNHITGSFILIDVISNNTVAAGIILDREPADRLPSNLTSGKAVKRSSREESSSLISLGDKSSKLGHKPATIWLTGLVSSGKREIAQQLEKRLFERSSVSLILDGSTVRSGLSRELDFSAADRAENLRRAAETARLLNNNSIISICSFVSPDMDIREQAAEIIGEDRFFEIYVKASPEYCRKRDKTGLYAKSDDNTVSNLPGVNSQYEAPVNPSMVLDMENISTDEAVENIMELLEKSGVFIKK